MFTPRFHTNPAKVVRTMTPHMVTPTVLFNRRMTFGTFLCVYTNPIRRLEIVIARRAQFLEIVLEPLPDERTGARLMIFKGTAKTEPVATGAADGGDSVIELGGGDVAFYDVFAVGCRTPFEVIVIVDVRLIQ